jgi:ribonuclease P protein component
VPSSSVVVHAAASDSPPEGRRPAGRPRGGRLTRSADFDAVHRLGRAVGGRYLTLRARRRDDDAPSRVGYAVPRRVGGAVDRNAVKRRLREAVAREAGLLEPGRDYVLIAREGLAPAIEAQGFDWLCTQVRELLEAGRAAS